MTVAIVTGSTQGLGESIARALAARGARVLVTGRNPERGERVAESIDGAFIAADLVDPSSPEVIVDACVQNFGRVDALVNAAGLTDRGTITDTTPELYERLMTVNLKAPFFLMQSCVKRMRAQGDGGCIVSIASMSAHGGQSFLTPYSTSKGALVILTKNVANALRSDRIRANVINLGWTDTPAEHAIQRAEGAPEDWLAKAEAAQPFGRLIKPEDCARLTSFLIFDAPMMTGAAIDLDQNVMGTYE